MLFTILLIASTSQTVLIGQVKHKAMVEYQVKKINQCHQQSKGRSV